MHPIQTTAARKEERPPRPRPDDRGTRAPMGGGDRSKSIIPLLVAAVDLLVPAQALVGLPPLIWRAMPMLIQVVFIMFIAVGQFVAIFWFLSKGGVDVYMPDDISTRFTDVWGQDNVLERVQENMVFLENPEEIEERGGHVPTGILLWGPPGTGKTLMAEAVAGETGKPFVFV